MSNIGVIVHSVVLIITGYILLSIPIFGHVMIISGFIGIITIILSYIKSYINKVLNTPPLSFKKFKKFQVILNYIQNY